MVGANNKLQFRRPSLTPKRSVTSSMERARKKIGKEYFLNLHVKQIARTGSSARLVPMPNTDKPGKSLSLARACISFADPIRPMRAEKKVVENSPAKMMGGQILVS